MKPSSPHPAPKVTFYRDDANPGDPRALTAALARVILSAEQRRRERAAASAEAEEQGEEASQ